MFELLPASPMNAVLPVEMHQATPTVGIDGVNSVDLSNDDHPPPKKLGVAGIDVLSSGDIYDPNYPPKKS